MPITKRETTTLAVRVAPHIVATTENILPGQPLKVTWRFNNGVLVHGPDSVSVRFFVNGQLVRQRDGIPATANLGGTGDQSETITIPDRNIALLAYRFGWKKLEIEVRDEKISGDTYWAMLHFFVAREAIDSSWWQWKVPSWAKVDWKADYALIGDFINRSQFAAMANISVEPSEVRSDDDPQINPCDYSPFRVDTRLNIVPQGTETFVFNLKQEWSWLLSAVYVVKGPLSKTFAYAVYFECTDEFGNRYEGACSTRLSRFVGVSAAKRAAGATAMGAAASAAALLVLAGAAAASIIWAAAAPALLAAAGAAYGVASAAGAIAKDPPAPDPKYRETVSVVPLHLPPWPSDLPEALRPLCNLLETAARLLALENARTVVRARRLGARVFGDEAAVELQRQSYLKFEQEMAACADTLEQLVPAVQKALEATGLVDNSSVSAFIEAMARDGLSLPMREAMTKAGLNLTEISELNALLLSGAYTELVRAHGLFHRPLVVFLREFVQAVQAERDTVLAEEFCTPADGSHPTIPPEEEEVVDPGASPRPRHKCHCKH